MKLSARVYYRHWRLTVGLPPDIWETECEFSLQSSKVAYKIEIKIGENSE